VTIVDIPPDGSPCSSPVRRSRENLHVIRHVSDLEFPREKTPQKIHALALEKLMTGNARIRMKSPHQKVNAGQPGGKRWMHPDTSITHHASRAAARPPINP
jgi:hypothetical protein